MEKLCVWFVRRYSRRSPSYRWQVQVQKHSAAGLRWVSSVESGYARVRHGRASRSRPGAEAGLPLADALLRGAHQATDEAREPARQRSHRRQADHGERPGDDRLP